MSDGNRPVDASALKALAHPLRTAMLSRLMDHGSATATQLAKELGESTGQTSYHLRQLERHGLVEDDPERSGGRERWWRPVAFRAEAAELRDDPQGRAGLDSARQWALADRVQALTRWGARAFDDRVWSEPATMLTSGGRLTVAEAEALGGALEAVVVDHLDRARAAEAEGGHDPRRRIRVYVDVVPVVDDDAPAPHD
ncbi:helix-turn-helix domain-containing protein [Cellulomonas sp. RIT-PI-Y]|uniref:ArsR/SmtB family transcription factor n=1 Tax=Cellulomonas sp. RIT-PI-Y TaxID=3035297 RepID=UPI0021DAEB61|nr:helix-turn-helix domain-containing protein [Cellulomonas sp. RIT-PI-Y]